MSYTLKERFANKNKIQNMSLLEIYKQYGNRDLLKKEINRRISVNIEEVRNFYKYNNPNVYISDYKKDLIELSNLLNISIVKLLDWPCFIDVNDNIANEYLDSNDSWLEYKSLPKKVSKEFLYKTLLKNNNIYKYPNLVELLSNHQIEQILLSKQIDYNRIPNMIELIKKSNLSSLKIKKILEKIYLQKNYELLVQLLSLDILKSNDIEQIILEIQNSLSFEEYLNLLDSLPSNILYQINQNSRLFEEIIRPYLNDEELIKKILNSKFGSFLNIEQFKKLIFMLSPEKRFDILITNNEFYGKIKKIINLDDFSKYFNENTNKCLNRLTQSDLLLDALNDFSFPYKIPDDVAENCYQYILNNIDSLKFCINHRITFGKNHSIISYIYNPQTNLSNYQQQNIIQVFNLLSLNTNELFLIFDKYNFIMKQVVNSDIIEKYIKNKGNEEIMFTCLDRYPEILTIIDLNLIINLDYTVIMRYFDKYPKTEDMLMHNEEFINYILSDEKKTFCFMPLINKYNINNETIKKYNDGFNKIRQTRQELSWGNSSLKPEMLSEDFINILGIEYIDAILQYDSKSSDIVVDLYNQKKLEKLKLWLDYAIQNISNNHRMIHYYIMSYNKMENLAEELISNKTTLNDYQKQILEEIIDNNNKYNIKSINDLENYFQLKVNRLLSGKDKIDSDEINELFLNTSSLQNGVPWGLRFNIGDLNLDYIKYKYVKTGIITREEYEYLEEVKKTVLNNDMSMVYDLITKCVNKNVPTARSIINKIRKSKLDELNSKLLDLDEVKKIASYTDPTAEVYIEIKDGVEYIHLNGYDFKCMACTVGTIGEKKSTFSHKFRNGFEQYTILSERIKENANNHNIGQLSLSDLIHDNPENWNLIEGISTVSTGLSSSRNNHLGYAWGRKSNISVLGFSKSDGMVSHKIRDLSPNYTFWNSHIYERLYDNIGGEFWFDRLNQNNERIQPEFIMGSYTEDEVKAAKFFGIPIVIKNREYYDDKYEDKLDLLARKKFLETYDVSVVDDILFNHKNKSENEKVDFLIYALEQAFSSNIIDHQTYISKLIDLKWKLYETNFEKQMEKVDFIISELSNYELPDFKKNL